jgi:hypothetical protein
MVFINSLEVPDNNMFELLDHLDTQLMNLKSTQSKDISLYRTWITNLESILFTPS